MPITMLNRLLRPRPVWNVTAIRKGPETRILTSIGWKVGKWMMLLVESSPGLAKSSHCEITFEAVVANTV